MPLVAVDVPPPKGAEKAVKLLIGNSNEEIGADLAKAILPKIPEGAKGQILMGTDTPGLPVLEQRNKGFQDVIKKERPGVTFLVFDAKQSPTDNFNTWSAQVKAHPDALAYVGPGSQAAVSLTRIQKRDKGKKLVVGACDLDPVALEGVRDGYVTALISPEHWLKGYLAIKLMADAKQNGKDLPGGRLELRRADRQQGQHRRDHHAPEGRAEPEGLLRGQGPGAARQPGPAPQPAHGVSACSKREAFARRTAASSRWPARTSRSAPAPCTLSWVRTAPASRRW